MFFNNLAQIFNSRYESFYNKKNQDINKSVVVLEELKEEARKIIKEESSTMLRYYNTVKVYNYNDITKLINDAKKSYVEDEVDPGIEKPTIIKFDDKLIAKRKALSESYRQKYFESSVEASSARGLCNYYAPIDLSRHGLALVTPGKIEDVDKSIKIRQALANKTNENYEERKLYLQRKVDSLITLSRELNQKYSDEEFVEKFGDRLYDIFTLSEIQEDNIEKLEKDFGVKVDESFKEKWVNNAKLAVSVSVLINRFSVIANPEYAYIDEKDMSNVNSYITMYSMTSGKFNISSKLDNDAKLQQMMDKEKASIEAINNENKKSNKPLVTSNEKAIEEDINATMNLGVEYFKSTVTSCSEDYRIQTTKESINNSLKMEYNVNPNTISCVDMLGNVITLSQASENIVKGNKSFDILDENGNYVKHIGNVSYDKSWSTIKGPKSSGAINIKTANSAIIKASLKNLVKLVDNTTHFYMKSSPQYREFRKTLNRIAKSDITDREKLANSLNDLANKAKEYLAYKERPDARITSNTIPRIEAAEQVLDFAAGSISLSKANVVEKEKVNDINFKFNTHKEENKEVVPTLEPVLEVDEDKEELEDSKEDIKEKQNELEDEKEIPHLEK